MSIKMTVNNQSMSFDKKPDICPICHHAIEPSFKGSSITGVSNETGTLVDVAYQCTQGQCKRMFVGRYKKMLGNNVGIASGDFKLIESVPMTYKDPYVAPEILEISPGFISIFKQATAAESYGLDEIAGVGYRKALEFLIKDYCIHKDPESEETIKKSFLGSVIRDSVDDANVKMCAMRATWLGNDETHYVRKWEDKDITDLKLLIELTCGWVRNNILTEKYIADMA